MNMTGKVKAIKALASEVRALDTEEEFTSLVEDVEYVDITDEEEFNTLYQSLEDAKRSLKKQSRKE